MPQDPGPRLLHLLAHDHAFVPLSLHSLKMNTLLFPWAINPHAFHVNSFSFLTFAVAFRNPPDIDNFVITKCF